MDGWIMEIIATLASGEMPLAINGFINEGHCRVWVEFYTLYFTEAFAENSLQDMSVECMSKDEFLYGNESI